MSDKLPEFVQPMLAELTREPFDSDEHYFEVKWDGTRALAFIEGGGYRLRNRNEHDSTPRYPELAFLHTLPSGTVLDGEIVMLKDGKPDFQLMLQREQARTERRARELAASIPASYVVFDVLYRDGRSVMDEPLARRREVLQNVLDGCDDGRLVLSDGLVGSGIAFFEQLREMELEGMVAKELQSPYTPGRRDGSWKKIKAFSQMVCAIIGYIAEGRDLRSLVIAAETDGVLHSIGRVGSGLSAAKAARVMQRLRGRERDTPIVECADPAVWVEPGLYCTVNYLERSDAGLRAPVFVDLIEDAGSGSTP